jgi:chorismate-pyruvate lyase
MSHPTSVHGLRRDQDRLIRLLRDSDSATKTLSGWTGSPINLRMVSRRDDMLADSEFADLDLWHTAPVQRREVCLMDARGTVLSAATSVVVLSRLPRAAASELCETDIPLGLVLARLQVRRHTLKVTRKAWAGGEETEVLFEVTARMDVGGIPVAMVHEKYTEDAVHSAVPEAQP